MSESQAAEAKLVGSVIADRFLVKRKLAAGGMGVVYLGEQIPLGRPVAIKILDTHLLDEERATNFSERFFLEAAAVAQLQHPNTITIYDYGKTGDEIYFYAMEYVDGASMSHLVHAEGPLPPAAVTHIGIQICASLREAHRSGMIHRDLKPGNIMVTERHDDPLFVKVLDFGLVKVMGQEESTADLTQSGTLLGSPRYMAPEQVLRFELDHRVDIYALGGVLYHALTGFPPFQHESQFQVLRAQVEEQPPPFADVYPECQATPMLEALVMKCLEKERRDRPADMQAVAEGLIDCARELGVEEASLSGPMRLLSSPGRESPNEVLEDDNATCETKSVRMPKMPATDVTSSQVRRSGPIDDAPEPSAAEATPGRSSSLARWVLLGVISLLAAAGGVVAVTVLDDESTPEPAVGPPAPVADEIAPSPAGASPPLRIETDPPGALVQHGDMDLGDAPFTLEIPEGERWELTISLDGYRSRTVLATRGRDVLHVRLSPDAAQAVPHRRGHRRRPAPTTDEPAGATPPETTTGDPPEENRFEDRGDMRHPWRP